MWTSMLRILSLSAIALLTLFAHTVRAETDIVAKVGTIAVTNFELQREIRKRIPLETAFHSGMKPEKIEQIRTAALDQLIERSYKVQYALDNQLSVAPDELDRRMQEFLGKYASPEQLTKALGGETLEAYRASIYRQLLAEKAEEVVVGSRSKVSEKEVSIALRSQLGEEVYFQLAHHNPKKYLYETAQSKSKTISKRQKSI